MNENDAEILRVLADAIRCDNRDVIDCIVGAPDRPGDLKLPLSPEAAARLLLAYLQRQTSPTGQPIDAADRARIKAAIDREPR